MAEEIKSGMYDDLPMVKIGKFTISMLYENEEESIWIKNRETGEGSGFPVVLLEPVIEKFFNKYF